MIGVLFGKFVLPHQPVNLRSASVEIDEVRVNFNSRSVVGKSFAKPA